MLDDSYVEPKDPSEDPKDLTELYLSYYLRYYIILSVGFGQSEQHICPNFKAMSVINQIFLCWKKIIWKK